MYPFTTDDQPEVPHQHRIFAAAAELQAAYEAGEDFTKGMPLSESIVLLTLQAVDDTVHEMIENWRNGPTVPVKIPPYALPAAPFPSVLELRAETSVMVSREGRAERGLPPVKTHWQDE
ncbi:hypothetical protein [Arthrobacter caoxuetaonis]|uniref:Uncharacterized protein n=1 Tax=Arthrobacter caoxuetaonis TaxID=2886935 RepID=A0A9X1SE15_9MICC|nr:hypothetical protein [Arthrobacter caoxuetaonis]MCC3299397.1 hypothetical protein [Arthrobacter caoxuetaonis]USQ59110.1 hypothetical protein NF551_18565 [Arthrobacter caoxuetaonis]